MNRAEAGKRQEDLKEKERALEKAKAERDNAKKAAQRLTEENRELKDGDAKTACQTACQTNAIVFGNANDKSSSITKVRNDNPQRAYYVLEQLHVLPNVTYLAKVRNTDEIIESEGHEAEAGKEVEIPAVKKETEAVK